MSPPRISPTVVSDVTVMRGDVGPAQPARYRIPLDLGALFRFVVGSSLPDDGWNVIVPTGGGTFGAWQRVTASDRGDDLTNADTTIQIGGKPWRVLPAATLSTDRVLTLGTVNAQDGDTFDITRLDASAFLYTIANGGPGAGTLVTLPISARSFARFQFDGANWALRDSHLML